MTRSRGYYIVRGIVRGIVYIGLVASFLACSWLSIMLLWAVLTRP
jgi:hypothetical protein